MIFTATEATSASLFCFPWRTIKALKPLQVKNQAIWFSFFFNFDDLRLEACIEFAFAVFLFPLGLRKIEQVRDRSKR